VDELWLTLTETNMWCFLEKRGNVYLCTFSVNGHPMRKALMANIFALTEAKDCPIYGFILVDSRTPANEVGYQTAAWKQCFEGKEVYIKILPGRPLDATPLQRVTERDRVGGSTLIFFPRKGICVSDGTYNLANLGILTCVPIGVGRTHSIMWVPCCKGSPTSGVGLGMKLKEWFITKRAPAFATGAEKDRATKFDPVHWVWEVMIPDMVARSQLNSSHVGVILIG
jgi:hypothetical protein